MFNPKERLQQLRKNKTVKEEASNFLAQNNNPVPLFQESPKPAEDNSDFAARLARLQNTVTELTGQLRNSNEVVHTLRKEKSELETKLLRLQYENSQLKVSNKSVLEETTRREDISSSRPLIRESNQGRRMQHMLPERVYSQPASEESLVPEVEQALDQVRKEPIENILKKMEHNFRALKADPRQITTGNKLLRDFAAICKDYNKTLKKPVLVIKLNASDFD